MAHTKNEGKPAVSEQELVEKQKMSSDQENNSETDSGFDHNTSDQHMRIDEEGNEVGPEDQA